MISTSMRLFDFVPYAMITFMHLLLTSSSNSVHVLNEHSSIPVNRSLQTFVTSSSRILLAPGAGYTHWKQTVFYFPDYATIKRDEVLEGRFSSKVNLENPVCRYTEYSRHCSLFFLLVEKIGIWY